MEYFIKKGKSRRTARNIYVSSALIFLQKLKEVLEAFHLDENAEIFFLHDSHHIFLKMRYRNLNFSSSVNRKILLHN